MGPGWVHHTNVAAAAAPGCRFLMGTSDSDSEDERRVVKSAKDKAHEELQATCNEIKVRRRWGDGAEGGGRRAGWR